jgi:hypothetical protein
MPHTDDDTVLAQAIFDLLDANKSALNLDLVMYGFQVLIPTSTAAVVMARGNTKALAGVQGPGGRTLNNLMIGIDVHRSKVGNEDTERKVVDSTANDIISLVHNDTTVGGLIIHGFFDRTDRGDTSFMNGSMFRTVVLSFTGITKTLIQ